MKFLLRCASIIDSEVVCFTNKQTNICETYSVYGRVEQTFIFCHFWYITAEIIHCIAEGLKLNSQGKQNNVSYSRSAVPEIVTTFTIRYMGWIIHSKITSEKIESYKYRLSRERLDALPVIEKVFALWVDGIMCVCFFMRGMQMNSIWEALRYKRIHFKVH